MRLTPLIRFLLPVLALLLLGATPTPTPTARPTVTPTPTARTSPSPTPGPRGVAPIERLLMRLQSGPDAPVLKEEILERAGLQAFKKPDVRATWKLLPGDSVAGKHPRPSDRVINLYTGTALAPVLLCRVVLRYFRDADGAWTPHFLVVEEPAVAFVNGRWQPVQLPGGGLPAVMVQYGSALPNAEGFFPTLEFGLTTGGFAVLGWQVQ